MSPFTGLSAFPITPVAATGALDAAALVRIVDDLCSAGVASVGVLGSTGAYPFHDNDLRKRAVRVAAEAVGRRVPLIVGVGALRTDTAVDLAREAARAGADALLLAPVSYTPLRDAEVFAHYRAVAAASDLPLCIYNNPGTTHFTFSDDLLARVADLPNVVAVKMPLPKGGDVAPDLERLRGTLPDSVAIGYSGDPGHADALLAGADAFFSALAGSLPAPFCAMWNAAGGDRTERIREIETAMRPILDLTHDWGSLRVAHAITRVRGIAEAPLPLPLLPLDGDAMLRLEAALPD